MVVGATPALRRAFAAVPRERFLGPGPWTLALPEGYVRTPDADPAHVRRDVTVALDPERSLHNGQPSVLARLIGHLGVHPGDRVLHVGCGTGYYTAILAELAGPAGRVTALEVDPGLAARARENLAGVPGVEVLAADGTRHDPGPVERILVNAGMTHPPALWLDRLAPGGVMVLPLSGRDRLGGFLRVERRRAERREVGYAAQFVLICAVYPCEGRDLKAESLLDGAFPHGGWPAVRSLRRDEHEREAACWLHGPGFCLSTEEGR
jgi:protein-L-isoaspartate(D-aspartate) O-methyltransferase